MALSMTLAGIAAALAAGETPESLIRTVYLRIAACPDPAVWISLRPLDDVLDEARTLQQRGAQPGQTLFGVPFAVKDNIDVAGLPTTAACPDFARYPAEDAPAVARLRAAGALVIGKTNLDQFATGLVGTRSPYGAPRCVFDSGYSSGGSSSGSAVAVARGQVAFALGTDTAGSGRVPAAFNHLVGVKPSKGLISSRGVVPACRSLDCVSVFAASCGEADLIRRLAQSFDPLDPFSRPAQDRSLPDSGLRVGLPPPDSLEFCGNAAYAACYQRTAETLAGLGATLVPVDFTPFRDAARLLYSGPWVAERLVALNDALTRFPDSFDPVVRQIVEQARTLSAADVFRGQYQLAALARLAEQQWQNMDVLLLPTTPTQYSLAEIAADPLGTNARLGHYTNFVNLLDCAAIAVPAGFTDAGLPFGVTLVGPAQTDAALARLGDQLHRACASSYGQDKSPLPAMPVVAAATVAADRVALAVVGAHLQGQPLHHQLTERHARLVARTRTAPHYRLFALANTTPPKPGLVADSGFTGPGQEVEVWDMDAAAFGSFVALVPPPLGIGTVTLADGCRVKGFICEPDGLTNACEITHFGGWRAYLASPAMAQTE